MKKNDPSSEVSENMKKEPYFLNIAPVLSGHEEERISGVRESNNSLDGRRKGVVRNFRRRPVGA